MEKNYNVVTLPKADFDAIEAKEYYLSISLTVLKNFENTLEKALQSLQYLPYRTRKKKYNSLILTTFPYKINYVIDNHTKTILVSSIFNMKQDPNKEI